MFLSNCSSPMYSDCGFWTPKAECVLEGGKDTSVHQGEDIKL